MIPYYDASSFTGITPDMRASFDAQSVLVLENLISINDCDALKAQLLTLIDEFDADSHACTFRTTDNNEGLDNYFMESGGDIRFFFEDGVFDDTGALKVPKHQAINKVGHALHDLDPVFTPFSHRREFGQIAKGLGQADPLLLQSMYILKPPHHGGEVICHQDSTYLWTNPNTCLGIWIAIEDATIENGCLFGIPTTKGTEPLRSRYRRVFDETGHYVGTTTDDLDNTPFAEEKKIALPVKKGSVIVFDGQFPHLSAANTSDLSRHAYAIHLIDGAADYPADNWLQRPAGMPLTGFKE